MLESEGCAICYEKFVDDKMVTNCKHTFHPSCLEQWFQQRKYCAFCRSDVHWTDLFKREEASDEWQLDQHIEHPVGPYVARRYFDEFTDTYESDDDDLEDIDTESIRMFLENQQMPLMRTSAPISFPCVACDVRIQLVSGAYTRCRWHRAANCESFCHLACLTAEARAKYESESEWVCEHCSLDNVRRRTMSG